MPAAGPGARGAAIRQPGTEPAVTAGVGASLALRWIISNGESCLGPESSHDDNDCVTER